MLAPDIATTRLVAKRISALDYELLRQATVDRAAEQLALAQGGDLSAAHRSAIRAHLVAYMLRQGPDDTLELLEWLHVEALAHQPLMAERGR